MFSQQKLSKLSKVITIRMQFLIRTGQVTAEVVSSRNIDGSVPYSTSSRRGWRIS